MHVPPPALALAAALTQRAITPSAEPGKVRTVAAGALAAAGAALAGSAAAQFRRQHTTVDPIHPDRASALVTGGPNRFSRNPMYLGMATVLAGHAVRRGPRALLPLAAFVAYIDRLQVQPEEKALRARFGEEYDAYCRRVRRWI